MAATDGRSSRRQAGCKFRSGNLDAAMYFEASAQSQTPDPNDSSHLFVGFIRKCPSAATVAHGFAERALVGGQRIKVAIKMQRTQAAARSIFTPY